VKLVAYLRVSTEKQSEEGLGLEVQEQAIRRWARKNGHRVVDVLTDAGVSGSNGLENRNELSIALEALRDGIAGGLVVYRLDRLARDLVVQEQLLMEIRNLGGRVFSTAGGEQDYLTDDPDDPSRRLIRHVLGAVNDYERAMIRLRLRRGQQRKAELGGYAAGRPRYGYRAEGKQLVEVPGEQEVIKRVRRLRRAGNSYRQIAALLEGEKVRPRSGGTWHPTMVARLLHSARS
jgi:DNA invertase Pin-like site-specific DNA recombinase